MHSGRVMICVITLKSRVLKYLLRQKEEKSIRENKNGGLEKRGKSEKEKKR